MTEDQKLERVVYFAMQAHNLEDSSLAFILLDISKNAAQQLPPCVLPDDLHEQVRYYFSELLPEISRRLCKMDNIHVATPRDPCLSELSDSDLRLCLANFISSDGYREISSLLAGEGRKHDHVRAIDIATASVANGNIFTIALDRICSGPLDDVMSETVVTTSGIGGVPVEDGRWHPGVSRNIVEYLPDAVDPDTIMDGIAMAGTANRNKRPDHDSIAMMA
ncbi:hypothetical protein [Pseudosulfitobacter pseudonitzschiae]|uniref:hypothetical protein n=1 Tax=Pseudosulfitobacter pseudonitzschiae TaxID=1402135 RepID=UPI003B7B3150